MTQETKDETTLIQDKINEANGKYSFTCAEIGQIEWNIKQLNDEKERRYITIRNLDVEVGALKKELEKTKKKEALDL